MSRMATLPADFSMNKITMSILIPIGHSSIRAFHLHNIMAPHTAIRTLRRIGQRHQHLLLMETPLRHRASTLNHFLQPRLSKTTSTIHLTDLRSSPNPWIRHSSHLPRNRHQTRPWPALQQTQIQIQSRQPPYKPTLPSPRIIRASKVLRLLLISRK